MKKITTLLIAVGAFVAVQAQTSREEARRIILGSPKGSSTTTYPSSTSQNPRDIILGGGGNNGTTYPNSYPSSYPAGSREAQVDQVNREYNAKIQSVRNNPYLSQAEKDRAIRQLENDRARRIRAIYGQSGNYNKGNHKRYDRDEDDDDRYEGRHDNGKHLGWEKGKGNPHKNGGKNWKKD
jgi:hypothetical protein